MSQETITALVLDVSTTKTGWCLMRGSAKRDSESAIPELICYGTAERVVETSHEPYPWGYLGAAQAMAYQIALLAAQHTPDVIVAEETNQGRSRWTQKILEYTHCTMLQMLRTIQPKVFYVSTRDWRNILTVRLSKEDKRQNARLSKAKKAGKKLDGVRGRVTPKHVAVRWANNAFANQLAKPLIQKDNDTAEALTLGVAWFRGVPTSDGTGW